MIVTDLNKRERERLIDIMGALIDAYIDCHKALKISDDSGLAASYTVALLLSKSLNSVLVPVMLQAVSVDIPETPHDH